MNRQEGSIYKKAVHPDIDTEFTTTYDPVEVITMATQRTYTFTLTKPDVNNLITENEFECLIIDILGLTNNMPKNLSRAAAVRALERALDYWNWEDEGDC